MELDFPDASGNLARLESIGADGRIRGRIHGCLTATCWNPDGTHADSRHDLAPADVNTFRRVFDAERCKRTPYVDSKYHVLVLPPDPRPLVLDHGQFRRGMAR